ncbi:TetR/AcrR family transcriptional regulator [Megasphaera vaginalis (ex Srinivasan et al. 2021)]|uniref:Transcriptional regulator, TetR family n=1 Tax=Megasphaera vaginalis (ex Srinivasan et al. 2021) TaxID=1111454 RepID=U7USV0_9FIRM|nr:TetR/AcrR family transcriptional regulator [Megasphaera vaginalis (ex Srinivasan et al. 2021)]ERT62517.1 transcriptional regulator, TetR family [Megasphaera vaginalis (ex Srinivasan et al. 2021)]
MARLPAKEKHDEEVRRKVLMSAKRLFIEQGYAKTTIRQIVDDSGIMIGSIYHFFKNKADIFQSLMQEMLDQSSRLVKERFGRESAVIQIAIIFLIEIEAIKSNKNVRDSFFEGDAMLEAFEHRIDSISHLSQQLFAELLPSLAYEDYFARTLLIHGMMRSYITSYYFTRKVQTKLSYGLFLRMVLPVYGVKEAEIAVITARIEALHQQIHDVTQDLITRVTVR